MEYRDWEILRELYQQKNITKTADALFISQPALTNRLKQIQEEFGVKIINPRRRGIEFTKEGEYLAKCALKALDHYRGIKETLAKMERSVAGTLRIGASNFFTKYKLGPILRDFQSVYPSVEFQILTGWSSEILKAIHNREIHVGFVRGNYNWNGMKHQLFEETLSIASKKPIDLVSLPKESRIEYRTDPFLKSIIDDWWKENYSEAPVTSIEVDQVDTCKSMVINGLGYGIMPSEILKDIDDLHKVEIKNKEGQLIKRSTWMYYYEEALEINAVNLFIDLVEKSDIRNDNL